MAGKQPNIVFILCDNVGWGDFSCYGGQTPTPRIDKLASEGIRFNAYTTESQCCPTRTGLTDGTPVGALRHVLGDSGRRAEWTGAVGVHDRRTALRLGLRDVTVGQVASR